MLTVARILLQTAFKQRIFAVISNLQSSLIIDIASNLYSTLAPM
jgi:hypothetical protein